MRGVENSPALGIIKEFFRADSQLAKELTLYHTLVNEKFNRADKAEYLVNTVIKLRGKLKKEALQKQKYALIREVKEHYLLEDFFKTTIKDYKLYASIYRIFEGITISKAADVVRSRFVVVEHLTRNKQQNQEENQITETYIKQDEEVRLLAYKLMIDKFNAKYANLSPRQRNVLKEYINNVSNTTNLRQFVITESQQIKAAIEKLSEKVADQITTIKLKEVCNLLDRYSKAKIVKEEHVLSLLLYYELIKELKNVK